MITPEQLAKAGNEGAHQSALFLWAQLNKVTYPQLQLMFAVPNGDSRGGDRVSAAIVGGRLKAQGVKSGVPDIVLAVARRGYHGLYLELKVGTNKPSDNQDWWLAMLSQEGYCTGVRWGWESARDFLIWYLS